MISKKQFGKATKYTMSNKNGIEVGILDYGCIVQSIITPDREGQISDIVLGFEDFQDYLGVHPYFGAVIGRYGNRIGGGRFELEGREYELAVNNGPNHLHGGLVGFDKKFWKAEVEEDKLQLSYRSVHMEEGYPGNLDVMVTYQLDELNRFLISYEAKCDQATVLNLTNHSYYNLSGSGTILEHEVSINASHYTPVNEHVIPTGEIRKVMGSPFDFNNMKAIGRDIDGEDEQLKIGNGYDHNFVLDNPSLKEVSAELVDGRSGRVVKVYTDQPGIQFYTGNWLEGNYNGKLGNHYGRREGVCFETQHFPDSPNQKNFPSTVLLPGDTFNSTTIYQFGVE